MDISSSGPTQSNLIRDSRKVPSPDQAHKEVKETSKGQRRRDEVIISEQGHLLRKLRDAVRNTPDVREEKVSKLRDAVEQGKYHSSPSEIAKAILAARKK